MRIIPVCLPNIICLGTFHLFQQASVSIHTAKSEREKEMGKYKYYHVKADSDILYYKRYHCYPSDTYRTLCSKGLSKTDAFAFVEQRLREVINDNCTRRELMRNNQFHYCPIEETPFRFTSKDIELMNRAHQIIQESPATFPEEYRIITGEQLSFSFT